MWCGGEGGGVSFFSGKEREDKEEKAIDHGGSKPNSPQERSKKEGKMWGEKKKKKGVRNKPFFSGATLCQTRGVLRKQIQPDERSERNFG